MLEPPEQKNVQPSNSAELLPGMTIKSGKIRIILAEGIGREQLAAVLGVMVNAE